jgi:hypothetical protein
MRIKKKNAARLASISALGAGALGVAAGTAEAGTIVYNPIGVTVCCTWQTSVAFKGPSGSTLPGSPGFQAQAHSTTGFLAFRSLVSMAGLGGVMFKVGGPGTFLFFGSSGRKWSTLAGFRSAPAAIVGSRGATGYTKRVKGSYTHYKYYYYSTISHNKTRTVTRTGAGTTGGSITTLTRNTWAKGNTNGNVYAQFEFQYLGNPVYGWLEFSDAVCEGGCDIGGVDPAGYGPNVNLVGYGYNLPDQSTPEPSTLALSGLAALALGATGLRRWRAARKPAA